MSLVAKGVVSTVHITIIIHCGIKLVVCPMISAVLMSDHHGSARNLQKYEWKMFRSGFALIKDLVM